MDFTVILRSKQGKLIAQINAPDANQYTQYAYYLCDSNGNVIQKQMYINENEFVFNPQNSDIYYVKGFVRYKNSSNEEYTHLGSKPSNKVYYFPIKYIKFEELQKEEFKPKKPIIYDILWNGVHYQFLINYKPKSNKGVIWGTGDTIKNGSYPIFSRANWMNDINYTSIYYFDPTIYINDEITLGWGYGTNYNWYLEKIAYLINYILSKQNIDRKNILLYGSSGGGFMSIMLATLFRGKCAVINPQFIVENFYARHIEILTKASLKENEKFLKERTHVVELMKKEKYVPQIHLSQNIQAENDITTQLNPFLQELSLSGLDCTDRIKIDLYYDELGHNGMPSKEKCLQTIEEQLNLPSLDNEPDFIPSFSFINETEKYEIVDNITDCGNNTDNDKLYIIITIDTEGKYLNSPDFFECDFGLDGNCGVNYIMDELEKRNMRGVFFTNIYEHSNFTDKYEGYMEHLVKKISQRGHEVALHTHPNSKCLDYYNKPMNVLDYKKQYQIIKYGTDFIEKHTGKRPIAHRGGNYTCNDTTFKVLNDLGYSIDSSSFYGNLGGTGNRFCYFKSLNQVCKIDNLIEFPVITLFEKENKFRKFDINHLNTNYLIKLVEDMKKRKYFNAAQLMFHSFSFINQKGNKNSIAKFKASNTSAYGIDLNLTKRFEDFLEYLYNDPQIEVITFEEYTKKNIEIEPCWGDGLFNVNDETTDEFLNYSANKENERFYIQDTYQENAYKLKINFDKCGDTYIHLYFDDKYIQMYADDLLSGKLRVLKQIEPMEFKLDTLDFGVQFSKQYRTFQLYLQALNPIQLLATAYYKYRNPEYLKFSFEFVKKWLKYSQNENNIKNNPFLFNDHSVALRAENLIYFGQICSRTGIWSNELDELLYNILYHHGQWLYDDKNYTFKHNHGIMQDQALLHIAYVINKPEWAEKAKKRLLEQEKHAFNSEFVHVENSPGYAKMVAGLFEKIGLFLNNNGDKLGEKFIEDMNQNYHFYDWTVKPNGIVAQIGDTGNIPGCLYGNINNQKRKTEELYKIYPLSGYYFYRSNKSSDEDNKDTWKMFKAGYSSVTHKHCDDCSFMLYSKGYEIFVDCGVYGYTKDAYREYFTSAKAHNTVVVDDSTYICNKNKMNEVGFSQNEHLDIYDHITAFNNSYNGVKFTRDFYSADDLTVLVDTLQSNKKHTYSQIFHLSEQMRIISANDNEVVIKLADTGYIVRLKQLGTPVKLSVIKGDVNKADYGIISRGTNHLDVITTLKFDITADNTQFITSIAIENQDSMVRIGDEFKKSDTISLDFENNSLLLDDFTINLN